MLTLIAVFGIFIVLACAWGFADPNHLIGMIRKFSGAGGYAFAIGARVLLAAAAWLGAPQSLLPIFLQIVAVLSIFGAGVLLVMGISRYRKLIDWVAGFNRAVLHIWLVFGMAFGVAMIWVTGIV
jgi:hypothetical protein